MIAVIARRLCVLPVIAMLSIRNSEELASGSGLPQAAVHGGRF
jgi:hypothetical protein